VLNMFLLSKNTRMFPIVIIIPQEKNCTHIFISRTQNTYRQAILVIKKTSEITSARFRTEIVSWRCMTQGTKRNINFPHEELSVLLDITWIIYMCVGHSF
jgi:hypothetical protein